MYKLESGQATVLPLEIKTSFPIFIDQLYYEQSWGSNKWSLKGTSFHFKELNSSTRLNHEQFNIIIAKSLTIIKSSKFLNWEHNSIIIWLLAVFFLLTGLLFNHLVESWSDWINEFQLDREKTFNTWAHCIA
jgi:hypothetical protein